MPWYVFILRSGGTTDKFEDDAPNILALAERLDACRKDHVRLVTNVLDAPDDDEIKEAAAKKELVRKPELILTGSWDPDDIAHIIPFDEIGQLELEGEEAEDEVEEVISPKMLFKRKK